MDINKTKIPGTFKAKEVSVGESFHFCFLFSMLLWLHNLDFPVLVSHPCSYLFGNQWMGVCLCHQHHGICRSQRLWPPTKSSPRPNILLPPGLLFFFLDEWATKITPTLKPKDPYLYCNVCRQTISVCTSHDPRQLKNISDPRQKRTFMVFFYKVVNKVREQSVHWASFDHNDKANQPIAIIVNSE